MSFRLPGMEHPMQVRRRTFILGTILLVILIWLAYLISSLLNTEHKVHKPIPHQALVTITPPQSTQPVITFPTQTATVPPQPTPNISTPKPLIANTAVPSSKITEWKGKKRINVLLIGIDRRNAGQDARTDTIIVGSLDFKHNTINLVSIPRDLYVQLPGNLGYWKINAAYPLGETTRYSRKYGGGVGMLITTIRQDFGLNAIDEYGIVDFKGFTQGIDAIGGVDINVPTKLVDPAYPTANYKTKRVVFMPGKQHMNGERALEYARTRHPDSDFGRIRRQQQVLMAVKNKARNPAIILAAPSLIRIVGDNVQTSLSFTDQMRLIRWAAAVPKSNIHMYEIVGPIGNTQSGESVVWPEWDRVNAILHKAFGPSSGHKGH